MGQHLSIRNVVFGTGVPKICVPVGGSTPEDIFEEIAMAKDQKADLIEWRADCFAGLTESDKVQSFLGQLRRKAGEMPLLFTWRTEDKNLTVDVGLYKEMNLKAIATGQIDMVDIELFMGADICREISEAAQANGVKVIISNHDFTGTPPVAEIIRRMQMMREYGADIPKMAVMPFTPQDVIVLLQATAEYGGAYATGPFITMSMKKVGAVSRISGETFGSAVTFGSIKKASAPGQLTVKDLKHILNVLHNN